MKPEEFAQKALSAWDFEVAREATALLRALPGVRSLETQERLENLGWLHAVELDDLVRQREDLDLTDDEFNQCYLDVKSVYRPSWRPVEGYLWRVGSGPVEHQLAASCLHFARLKVARTHDRKKLRRELAGEARYHVFDLVRLLGDPVCPWLLQRFEDELALTAHLSRKSG